MRTLIASVIAFVACIVELGCENKTTTGTKVQTTTTTPGGETTRTVEKTIETTPNSATTTTTETIQTTGDNRAKPSP
jgi:hypothetical protein